MIRIFPSKLEGEPLEEHPTAAPITFDAWLSANVKNYQFRESPPISVHVNGRLLSVEEWRTVDIKRDDSVCVYPEPKWVGALLGVAAIILAIVLQPSIPKAAKQADKGRNLDEASVKGNKVKINSPIREVAGRRKIYPDYLVPLHRYFESSRQQIIKTHLCFGKGEFEIADSQILIGDTSIISLGDDSTYRIYGPGEDVSLDDRCQWWHSATEVGATSSGTSGIELTVTTEIDATPTATSYVFSGTSVTIPAGAGSFPDGWEGGMVVRIDALYPYTVTEGGAGLRDIINGDITQLGLTPGDTIEISGDNAGDYIVNTVNTGAGTLTLNYSDGSPAVALITGAMRMSISFRDHRYRLLTASTSSITLERLNSSGGPDLGWPGFSNITLDDATIVLDESDAEGGWVGPFSACPDGETTTLIEWDVFFPSGLIRIGSKGQILSWTVTYELQYRDAATAGDWIAIVRSHTSATNDQIGFTESIELPYAMRPEVRARRIGAKASIQGFQEIIQWYGLRAKLTPPASYAGVTTIALKITSGAKLAAQSEQLVSAIVTRKLPVRVDGEWQAAEVTRDIAPWVSYVAKSLGYTDDDLDLDELDRLDAVWKARGDTYDNSVEQRSTAKESINNALRAGMAELTIDRGLIRPVRDELRVFFDHMYTPQNMTDPLKRQFQAYTPDDFDGVDVEYTSSRTWQVETVECRLEGDLGARVEKIALEGVVSRTKAWQIGMRQRRSNKFRRYVYSFNTELDALNSRYMSYAALGDDVPGYNKSSILLGFALMGASVLLQSSEPFDWSEPGDHMVAIRKKDGTLSGPYVATQIDEYRLTVPGPLDFTPDTSWEGEPPHLLFGPVARWTYPALITEINPRGSSGCEVSAVNYDARAYADDDNEPPA